jgi:hypothetical protein
MDVGMGFGRDQDSRLKTFSTGYQWCGLEILLVNYPQAPIFSSVKRGQ